MYMWGCGICGGIFFGDNLPFWNLDFDIVEFSYLWFVNGIIRFGLLDDWFKIPSNFVSVASGGSSWGAGGYSCILKIKSIY